MKGNRKKQMRELKEKVDVLGDLAHVTSKLLLQVTKNREVDSARVADLSTSLEQMQLTIPSIQEKYHW